MKAFDMSFYFMASPSYYDIPFFQRTYVWGEENWKELYEDLSSKKINHFLGSVILKNEMVPAGSNSRYFVIDGQQRLTTLSILVRACYNHMAKNVIEFGFDEETLSQAKFQMRQILFVSEGEMKINYVPKINHSKLDKEAYENVIKGGLDNNDQWEKESYGEDSNDSQIVKAYVYFRNMLDNSSEEQVISFGRL